MEYSKAVLFSDLDGTLFNDQTEVPERNRQAVRRFCEGGGIFCISSGRIQSNILTYLKDLPVNGPCILYNGGALYDWKEKRFLLRRKLDMEAAKPFIGHVLEKFPQVDVQVYPGDGIYFLSPRESADRDFVEQHRPCIFTTLEQAPLGWMKVLMQGEPGILEQIRAEGTGYSGLGDFVSTRFDYLELLPYGVSKGSALREALKMPEFTNRVAVAIGDYYNDIELLQEAEVGVAPQNALEEVKKVADYIVCDNNQGAVADCIEYVIPSL